MKPRYFGLRAVDLAFAALDLFCLASLLHIPHPLGKAMFGSWAAACVAGIVFRWGWLLPTTLGAFIAVQMFQPFLHGYSHGPEENVQHGLIYPTVCAAIVAALQVGIAWAEAANRDTPEGDDRSISEGDADGPTPQ